MDLLSKSDPEVHVYIKDSKSKNFSFIGKTEMILNNLNPDFTKTFILDYYFEKEQLIKFEVHDIDVNGSDHIGNCETTISRIMSAQRQTFISDLKLPGKERTRGKIIIRADSVAQSNNEIAFSVSARLTSKGGMCCGSDNPYVLISRARSSQSGNENDFIRVFQTSSILGTHNPVWQPQKLKMQVFCNSDDMLPIKISVNQYQMHGTHPLYGEFVTTVRELSESQSKEFQLLDSRGRRTGVFKFDRFNLIERPSFVDYLRSGWFINMSVAIDFTASNGESFEPNSLHRIDPNGVFLNQYQSAIQSVGQVLEPYAFQSKFAVFGFGGVPRYTGATAVSHCFNLTGTQDPTVDGLVNMFNLYKTALHGTSLSGPTYFSQVLKVVLDYMKATMHLQMYHILLIITDGAIHDMKDTKDLIVECSLFPLSIIIVGVGNADFANMVELDGDDVILKNSKGQAAARDIVQFVKYSDFMNGDISILAEEVLREVPDQIVGYMLSKNIQPNPTPLMSQKTINQNSMMI